MKRTSSPFKRRRHAPDVILLRVLWYRRRRRPWWRAAQCSRTFHNAGRAIEGTEALHLMRKGQVERVAGSDAAGLTVFVGSLFVIAA